MRIYIIIGLCVNICVLLLNAIRGELPELPTKTWDRLWFCIGFGLGTAINVIIWPLLIIAGISDAARGV